MPTYEKLTERMLVARAPDAERIVTEVRKKRTPVLLRQLEDETFEIIVHSEHAAVLVEAARRVMEWKKSIEFFLE